MYYKILRYAILLLISISVGAAIGSADFDLSASSLPSLEDSFALNDRKDYNIVIISVDALRSDHLECYGYNRKTAPNMCGLAGKSVLFENAYSQAPWSLPAYTSLLTGKWPSRHGVETAKPVKSSLSLLPEILNREGYATAEFVDGGFLREWTNLDQGYNEYRSMRKGVGSVGHTEEVLGNASRFISDSEDSSFVFLHTMQVHSPYKPVNMTSFREFNPEGYDGSINVTDDELGAIADYSGRNLTEKEREHMIAGYDSTIKHTDQKIGEFIDGLNRSGQLEETIVIITSDHGESFQDHSLNVGHTDSLYEEYIKVPLLIYHPDYDSRRIKERVNLVDLMPTILEMNSIEKNRDIDGKSLLPLIKGQSQNRLIYSTNSRVQGTKDQITIIRRDMKLFWDKNKHTEELFNLSSDPEELNDVSRSNQEMVKDLKDEIRAIEKSGEGSDTEDKAVNKKIDKRLQDLGYKK